MLEKESVWPILLYCCKQDEMQLFKKRICLKNSKNYILAARAQQLAAAGTGDLKDCIPRPLLYIYQKQQQQLCSLWQKGTFKGCY